MRSSQVSLDDGLVLLYFGWQAFGDALAVFDEFGFREHLTPQRSNGLRSMVERIRSDARETLAAASVFLQKPFRGPELIAAVERAIGR